VTAPLSLTSLLISLYEKTQIFGGLLHHRKDIILTRLWADLAAWVASTPLLVDPRN